MAVMVICVYQPKSGKEEELQALLGEHHSTLRSLELTTDFVYYARAANAHDIPAVMEIWGRLSEVCDFKPLASLEEAKSPFSHFTPQAP